jgi:hypothetical protein
MEKDPWEMMKISSLPDVTGSFVAKLRGDKQGR